MSGDGGKVVVVVVVVVEVVVEVVVVVVVVVVGTIVTGAGAGVVGTCSVVETGGSVSGVLVGTGAAVVVESVPLHPAVMTVRPIRTKRPRR